VLAAVKTEFG
jgi:hypothetical protein